MKYYSQDDIYFNCECEKCGRVLKIQKTFCHGDGSYYKISSPIQCKCGNLSEDIFNVRPSVLLNYDANKQKSEIKQEPIKTTKQEKVSEVKRKKEKFIITMFIITAFVLATFYFIISTSMKLTSYKYDKELGNLSLFVENHSLKDYQVELIRDEDNVKLFSHYGYVNEDNKMVLENLFLMNGHYTIKFYSIFSDNKHIKTLSLSITDGYESHEELEARKSEHEKQVAEKKAAEEKKKAEEEAKLAEQKENDRIKAKETALKESQANFKKGSEAYRKKDYITATNFLYMVSIEDPNYKEAISLAERALKELYVKDCSIYEYKVLKKNADNFKNKKTTFTGRVLQIQEIGKKSLITMSTTHLGGLTWTDDILLLVDKQVDVYDEDIITIYGEIKGKYSTNSEYILDFLDTNKISIRYTNGTDLNSIPVINVGYIVKE